LVGLIVDDDGFEDIEFVGNGDDVDDGKAHLFVLSQSHGNEQLIKQFRSGSTSEYN